MSRRVSHKKQAILGIMLLLTLVVAVEGAALAWTGIFPTYCDIMESDAAEGLDAHLKRQICDDGYSLLHVSGDNYKMIKPDQHYPTININSHGFRGPEFESEKLEGTYRVFVIGGSSVFGTGVVDNATIPAHLERMYREAGPLPQSRIEVINAGVIHAQSHTESLMVKNQILRLDPDLLIVYDGHNDIHYSIDNPGLDEGWFRYKGGHPTDAGDGGANNPVINVTGSQHQQNVGYILDEIGIRSSVLHLVKTHVLGRNIVHDDSPILPKVAVWKERWGQICDIGRDRGFEVLVTVQPVLGSGNQTLTAYHETFYAEWNGEAIADKIHHYADALDELSSSCPFTLDLTHAFDGYVDGTDGVVRGGGSKVPVSSVALLDRVHLSDYGNRIIASKMYDASIPIIMSGSVT